MEVIGYLSTLFLIICGLPEAIHAYKSGNSGSTWGMLSCWWLGCALCIVYSISLKSYPLFWNNFINVALVGYILYKKYKFTQQGELNGT